METTLPAPPAEQVWLPLASSGSIYVSSGIPRILALTEQAGDDAMLRREIEMLTGCHVVIEARVPLRASALGFTHAALLVPSRVRALRRRKPMIPSVIRRAWR
ncbi:MAG: hypothetical protein ABI175_03405 [Polyangiales bacterium]